MSAAASINAILRQDSWSLSKPGMAIEGFEVIARQELDSGRWSRYDLVVVKDPDGGLWGWVDETGLTEMQEVEEPDFTVFPVRAVQSVSYEQVK